MKTLEEVKLEFDVNRSNWHINALSALNEIAEKFIEYAYVRSWSYVEMPPINKSLAEDFIKSLRSAGYAIKLNENAKYKWVYWNVIKSYALNEKNIINRYNLYTESTEQNDAVTITVYLNTEEK